MYVRRAQSHHDTGVASKINYYFVQVESLLHVDLSVDQASAASSPNRARVGSLDDWLQVSKPGTGDSMASPESRAPAVAASPNAPGLHGPSEEDKKNFEMHPDGYWVWISKPLDFPILAPEPAPKDMKKSKYVVG